MTEHYISGSAVFRLISRFYVEWKQVWKIQTVGDIMERLMFLLAFGFGMGAVVETMGGLPYIVFLIPALAASSGMHVMHFAMLYGAYERRTSTKLWQSWLSTPLKLQEIMLAELVYTSLRALVPLSILLILGIFWQAIPSLMGILISLPIIFLANLAMGAVALMMCAHVSRSMQFKYVNTLWTTPMYLFSGVFFDISQTPPLMQAFAKLFPLHHVINVTRPLMTGQNVHVWDILLHVLALVFVFICAFYIALNKLKHTLLD